MYLLVTSRKGISSMQLSKEIGITQKSAWFVLHRLREACGSKLEILRGISLNEGNVQRHTFQRLNSLIAATAKKRLTYADLIA